MLAIKYSRIFFFFSRLNLDLAMHIMCRFCYFQYNEVCNLLFLSLSLPPLSSLSIYRFSFSPEVLQKYSSGSGHWANIGKLMCGNYHIFSAVKKRKYFFFHSLYIIIQFSIHRPIFCRFFVFPFEALIRREKKVNSFFLYIYKENVMNECVISYCFSKVWIDGRWLGILYSNSQLNACTLWVERGKKINKYFHIKLCTSFINDFGCNDESASEMKNVL